MWLWDHQLRLLGFRRKSERYWRCERRFELPDGAHLSLFSWSEQFIPGPQRRQGRFLVELTEFHVTFVLDGEHLHFYYHERDENAWQPAGHTSNRELRRVGANPAELRAQADAVAAAFVASLSGNYGARKSE